MSRLFLILLFGQNLEEFIQKMKERLKARVNAAFIFGSYAKGIARNNSDIDIVLVTQTDRAFHERFLDFKDIYDLYEYGDLLIYTPEEFERLTSKPNNGFWRDFNKSKICILNGTGPV